MKKKPTKPGKKVNRNKKPPHLKSMADIIKDERERFLREAVGVSNLEVVCK